jgi:hypothetical protein
LLVLAHWVAVGLHCTHALVDPVVRQTDIEPVHVVVVCQVPVLSQVWMADPRQRVAPATQTPEQALL